MTLGLKNSRELPFDLIDAGTNTLAKMTDAKIRPGALNGPGSPQSNMASQARRNSSHWPPRPIRTPPGPISKDWEKADVGITKIAVDAATANASLRIRLSITNPPG